jgi:HK97 family phage prohead protease
MNNYWQSLEFKRDLNDTTGTITGYASVFDVVDQGNDVIKRGTYTKTIQDSKNAIMQGKQRYLIPMLFQHDPNQPIGGFTTLEEDQYGLKCTGQILLTLSKGIETWCMLKDGIINGLSIGYDVQPNGAYYDKGIRYITNVRLWEISLVTFPMCEQATITDVKAQRYTYNIW